LGSGSEGRERRRGRLLQARRRSELVLSRNAALLLPQGNVVTDDPKHFDPIHLFIRTDEKYEEVRAEVHDLNIQQKDIRNNLERVEKRVDFGVAVTGNKNSEELSRHAVDIGQLKQTQELQDLTIKNLEKT